jgi:hypothetical protein
MTPEATRLANQALRRVQEPKTGRVRVEDYLTVLAAITGEAALVASGVLDIETTQLTPGSPIFGDPMNQILSGDSTDLAAQPPDTVVGILVAELVPGTFELGDFEPLQGVYRRVAERVGSAPWGAVMAAVPDDHQPTVLPLQAAFELRPAVEAAVTEAGLPRSQRHVPCAQALAEGLRQVHGAIDGRIGLALALDVVFTMAKTVPMSRRAFEQLANAGPAQES